MRKENNIYIYASGVKHVIESPFADISKPLHHMMITGSFFCLKQIGSKKAMKKLKEMLTKKDKDETENENQLQMKQGEMKLSKFGFGFELTGFVAFLSWTGMCLSSLLGVVSVLLGALGMEPYFLMASGADYRNYETVSVLMQGFGCAFLVIAVGYFAMNFFLRKENRDNNAKGVKKMLTVICTINTVLTILVLPVTVYLIGIFIPISFGILIPALVFWCLLHLLLYGIVKGRSGFVKAFLVVTYTIFGLLTACIATTSFRIALGYGSFINFPSVLLFIMILTFLFVFYIGFYVALHSIYQENEKTQLQKKESIEFTNAPFENC